MPDTGEEGSLRESGDGLLGLWAPTRVGIIIQIPGVYADFIGRRLAGGRCKFEEIAAELGSYVEDIGPGGGGCQELRHLIKVSSAGGALIWIGDVGDSHPYWLNPGGFPPPGGPPSFRDETAAQCSVEMGLSTIGGKRINVRYR